MLIAAFYIFMFFIFYADAPSSFKLIMGIFMLVLFIITIIKGYKKAMK
jgi:hypothetical protein